MESLNCSGLEYNDLIKLWNQLSYEIKELNKSNLENNRKLKINYKLKKDLDNYIQQTFCYTIDNTVFGDK